MLVINDVLEQTLFGFSFLPQKVRKELIKTDYAKKIAAIHTKPSNYFWFRSNNHLDRQHELANFYQTLENDNDPDFLSTLNLINQTLLELYLPGFDVLSPKDKKKIARGKSGAHFRLLMKKYLLPILKKEQSFSLLDEWQRLSQGTLNNAEILKLQETMQAAMTSWADEWAEQDAEINFIMAKVKKNNARILKKHIDQLFKTSSLITIINDLSFNALKKDCLHLKTSNPDLVTIAQDIEHWTRDFLNLFVDRLPFELDVKAINKNLNTSFAKQLSEQLLNNFLNDEGFDFNHLIDEYKKTLMIWLEDQFFNSSHFNWKQPSLPQRLTETLKGSLSALLNTDLFRNGKLNVDQLADAFSFFQLLSPIQTDNPIITIANTYNIVKYAPVAQKAKSVLSSIFSIFQPLWHELKDVADETNPLKKVVRVAAPLLMITSFVVTVATIASALSVPSLGTVWLAIPAFFIGMAVTSGFTKFKNDCYSHVRNWLYGGTFQTPEYKVEPKSRMTIALGSIGANKVRDFYVQHIQKGQEKEKAYLALYKKGLLTKIQLEKREENIKKTQILLLEWYDIHHNPNLGVDQIKFIVQHRINLQQQKRFKKIYSALPAFKMKAFDYLTTQIDHLKHGEKPTSVQDKKVFLYETNQQISLFVKHSIIKERQKLNELNKLENDISISSQAQEEVPINYAFPNR